MYCTVIRHSGHLRTLGKCRKHSPAVRVFFISLVFSNDHRVLLQCNTRLRLLYLLSIERNVLVRCNCKTVCPALWCALQRARITRVQIRYYLEGRLRLNMNEIQPTEEEN